MSDIVEAYGPRELGSNRLDPDRRMTECAPVHRRLSLIDLAWTMSLPKTSNMSNMSASV